MQMSCLHVGAPVIVTHRLVEYEESRYMMKNENSET